MKAANAVATSSGAVLRLGELELEIIEACDLPASDFGGTSDPYVIATLRWVLQCA